MVDTDSDAVALEERLKSALWLAIGRIVDDETIKLGVDATPQFIGALTEMVWAQIETVGQDLEAFAKYGQLPTDAYMTFDDGENYLLHYFLSTDMQDGRLSMCQT
ncbi:hypothetical protein FQN53_005249 [Emmonsiellopsis sp. PD_33]|nr:hypothetical protein FQN53_005249 [Emmonsiellopsis sp. PD_33]